MRIKFIGLFLALLASALSVKSFSQDRNPEDVPLISYRIFPAQYESDEQFSRLLEFLNQ